MTTHYPFTSRNDMRLIGSHESDKDIRAPNSSFVSNIISFEAIARAVAEDKVVISSGYFYAKRLVENLGIKNTFIP